MLITVNMMNYFYRIKISSKMSFHYKSVFSNMTISITKWVGRHKNPYISSLVNRSTFIIRMLLTAFKFCLYGIMSSFFAYSMCIYFSFLAYEITLGRTVSILTSLATTKMRHKNFTTIFTYHFISISDLASHIYLSIKKALFGGLQETVKFLHLLRANVIDTKNLFPVSSYSIPQTTL